MDANATNQARHELDLLKQIYLLRSHLGKVESILFILQTYHVPDLVQELRSMEYDEDLAALDPSDLEQYFQDLNAVRLRSREVKIDLELLEIEYEELKKASAGKDSGTLDKKFFLNLLSRLATFKRVAVIRTSEISAAEFCAMWNEYLDHHKALTPKTPE